MRKVAASLLSVLAVCACARGARASQAGDGRTPTTNTPAEAPRTGRGKTGKPAAKSSSPPPAAAARARLAVRTDPPGSVVELDGRQVGTSDAAGNLNLPPTAAGEHTLVVRRNGYHEFRRVIELVNGPNATLDARLTPKPGYLGVEPRPAGSTIEVAGFGTFNGSVSGLEVKHGTYRVRVTRLGFRPLEEDVKVEPGSTSNVVLTLTRLHLSELISAAESAHQAGRYDDTVTLAGMALEDEPAHPRLNLMLGLTHLRKNDMPAALPYLRRAVALGETLSFNVKHFHTLKKGEGLCQGQLLLRRGVLEFRSAENPADSFLVPFAKVLNLRPDAEKGWRLSMKVLLLRGNKETGVDYSFHPSQAFLHNKDPRKPKSPTLVACTDCQPTVQFIYQVVEYVNR